MIQKTGVQWLSHTKDSKNILFDVSLLNTKYYKVWIKGKWGNPGKGVEPPPLHLDSFWKGTFQVTQLNLFTYIYKQDLALNYLQELICHKTQPTSDF